MYAFKALFWFANIFCFSMTNLNTMFLKFSYKFIFKFCILFQHCVTSNKLHLLSLWFFELLLVNPNGAYTRTLKSFRSVPRSKDWSLNCQSLMSWHNIVWSFMLLGWWWWFKMFKSCTITQLFCVKYFACSKCNSSFLQWWRILTCLKKLYQSLSNCIHALIATRRMNQKL